MFPSQQGSPPLLPSVPSIFVWDEATPVLWFLTDLLRSCTNANVEGFTDASQLLLCDRIEGPKLIIISAADPLDALGLLEQRRPFAAQGPTIVCTDIVRVKSWESFRRLEVWAVVNRTPHEIGMLVGAVQRTLFSSDQTKLGLRM